MPTLTDEHKRAMAEGRRQARAVKNYLAALETSRKRGPKPDPDKIQARIDEASAAIEAEDNPATRLELIQQRMDDQQQLEALTEQDSIEDLEGDFVDVVAAYSDRKGISYAAWREIGVPAATLRAGGLTRGS
ncbi:hypothetical protein [Salsipaludibacter albus]|uniref:hypothetical protein n=1 Tax=Salsipaludibacter albus TaxID=2849650 RepID=UPI001EE45FF2|nr:hypothetical protein [Salsipaludibacter albus]MBY5163157.1 hypothetical protein [Salsipaludibacter albus]